MRFIAALLGIAVSIPLLLFFWIGTRTFLRASERVLAVIVTAQSGALLILSATLFFTPSVQRPHAALLLTTIATIGILWAAYRARR